MNSKWLKSYKLYFLIKKGLRQRFTTRTMTKTYPMPYGSKNSNLESKKKQQTVIFDILLNTI